MTRLQLVGAGGHGRVVADTAHRAGWDEIVFLDDGYPSKQLNGQWPVVGHPQDLRPSDVFLCIGANAEREALWGKLSLSSSPVIAHPSAIISSSADLEDGVVAVAATVVQTGSRIGRGTILNTASSVDHDCDLGNFVHISPGARLAGGVSVGDRSWIGIGAVIRQGIRIGNDVVVGAGAAVIDDIDDGQIVVGVPARPQPQ